MQALPDLYQAEPIPAAALSEVTRLLNSGDLFRYTSDNSPVARLEVAFAARLGATYALAVSSCSAALFLSLKALDLPKGARVLIPAFTFAAVPSAVVHADCIPVLCECDSSYRIDLGDFAAKLPSVDAVLISHMRGHTSDMDAILSLCDAAGIPVIEDAAHSLGTTWHGRNIGTLGKIGCFSFQSYKLVNAGEGGIMVSDDAELIARAVIMSGAYEQNWAKHAVLHEACRRWQNRLPLYNLRMNALSAAVIIPQLQELDRRVADGRRNHDLVADRLRAHPFFDIPAPLAPERRAPDSIQFNLGGLDDDDLLAFTEAAARRGLKVQVFGKSPNNARAFWNWEFLGELPELPLTRSMLARACDLRLPPHLSVQDCEMIARLLLDVMDEVVQPRQRYGT
jgi:dTDP-4-amino-4,6-dideoxygalactose transaminase